MTRIHGPKAESTDKLIESAANPLKKLKQKRMNNGGAQLPSLFLQTAALSERLPERVPPLPQGDPVRSARADGLSHLRVSECRRRPALGGEEEPRDVTERRPPPRRLAAQARPLHRRVFLDGDAARGRRRRRVLLVVVAAANEVEDGHLGRVGSPSGAAGRS